MPNNASRKAYGLTLSFSCAVSGRRCRRFSEGQKAGPGGIAPPVAFSYRAKPSFIIEHLSFGIVFSGAYGGRTPEGRESAYDRNGAADAGSDPPKAGPPPGDSPKGAGAVRLRVARGAWGTPRAAPKTMRGRGQTSVGRGGGRCVGDTAAKVGPVRVAAPVGPGGEVGDPGGHGKPPGRCRSPPAGGRAGPHAAG